MTAPLRTAIVTGAGRGLGAAIADVLAERGTTVYRADLSGTSCRLDVTDAAACRALAARVRDEHGSLDAWVNNAGVLPTGPAWSMTDQQVEQTLAVNLRGTVNGTLAALAVLREQGSGSVVNVVSLAGLAVGPGQALYAASKHGALAFSLGAQVDLRVDRVRGVHVSALCPDGIWTPMLHDKVDDPWAAASWTGRLLRAADIAVLAVGLIDRPRPVLAVPRAKGPLLRLASALPSAYVALAPLVMRDARRRQRAFAAAAAQRPDGAR